MLCAFGFGGFSLRLLIESRFTEWDLCPIDLVSTVIYAMLSYYVMVLNPSRYRLWFIGFNVY